MFRSACLVLLALPLSQGFGVIAPTRSAPQVTLFAAPAEEPMFADDDFVDSDMMFDLEDDADMAMFQEEEVTTPKTAATQAKMADTLADLSAKAQDFVEDERVKEIAGKTAEFASDVVGQLFSKVGDKLKDLKKEREEKEAREKMME